MSETKGTHEWLKTAGPYFAVLVGVMASFIAFTFNDRSNAMERLSRVETHITDQDKHVSEQLSDIKKTLDDQNKAIRELSAAVERARR